MGNTGKNITYIIHGQSNAAGNVSSNNIASSLKTKLSNANILNLANSNVENLKVGVNSFGCPEEYFNQFLAVPSIGYRYGLEVELSKLLNERYSSSVNVFKYTWPGSGLNTTSQGGNWAYSNGNLMPKVASAYATFLDKSKIIGKPNFLVWIQGESNIGDPNNYKINLKAWIDQYRINIFYNIPLIVVSLSTGQSFLNSSQLATFKTMQNTLGSVVLDNSTNAYTLGTGYIDNCFVLSQNEVCQDEAGVLIHYSDVGISKIANGIFKIVKDKIIL